MNLTTNLTNQITKRLGLALLLTVGAFAVGMAQSTDDRKQVEQAIKDYVDAIYQKDTSKIYRSVHPDLAKRGYSRRDGKMTESLMTFPQLVKIAATWRQSDRKLLEPEITVFEVLDYTASAKLKADWGIDYFHLSKISGTWKIYNVIWQSHPSPGGGAGNR